ncbi:hypothetical protein EYD10_05299 [Varanus komodoensis]|nr:hypothetical protein EYD10_05299 [Varanus komodoensis]
MEPKPRLFKRSASPGGSGRICSPPPGLTSAGPCCPDSSPPAAGLYCGVISACNKPLPAAASNAVYTVLVEDPASLRRRSRRRSAGEDGAGKNPGGKGRLQLLQKVRRRERRAPSRRGEPRSGPSLCCQGCPRSGGGWHQALLVFFQSPSHCNGKVFPGEAESINGQLRSLSDPLGLKQPEEEAAALRLLEQSPLHQSAYIPVPRQRKGKMFPVLMDEGNSWKIGDVNLALMNLNILPLLNCPCLWWDPGKYYSVKELERANQMTRFWKQRLSEKAGIDEVMAAAVLTSLSTSPVVLNHAPNGFGTEMNGDAWKEGLGMSSSCSSNSGDWSWDAPSDLSTPSTPSPPLSTDAAPSFLSSLQSELEETEATHFLFGDPIPRKRKNSTKVMFKCLWKNCGKVLSSSSGMQKHIRTIHLGRKADLDQSDGEEDFYYTELDVNVDSLTDGLSSLTPVSPTSSVPPAFPILEEVQETPPIPFKPEVSMVSHLSQSTPMTILSQSAPTSLCHIQTDHAYQASGPAGVLTDLTAPATGMEISISWQQPALFPPPLPPVLFKSPAGCLTPIRPADAGEKPPPAPHTPVAKGHPIVPSSVPKPTAGTRKPRGEAKKCRKVYGMENRNMWCTACRWKKACQRFVD